MNIKYVHTNIISKDWKSLARFYINVFNCTPSPPERNQKGEWLDKGTGVKNAHLKGVHLLLPGQEKPGSTLEIYEYSNIIESDLSQANSTGYGHIAFQTDDIETLLEKALRKGAKKLGELSSKKIEGIGIITFIYIRDPEGNIIELQKWTK